MADQDRRSSMFTVRNAENAMITFSIIAIAILISVFLHQFVLRGNGFVDSLYAVAENISKIMSAATMLTILEEGIDIMFQRIRDTLKKEKQLIAEAKAEAKQKEKQRCTRRSQRGMNAEDKPNPVANRSQNPSQDLQKDNKESTSYSSVLE